MPRSFSAPVPSVTTWRTPPRSSRSRRSSGVSSEVAEPVDGPVEASEHGRAEVAVRGGVVVAVLEEEVARAAKGFGRAHGALGVGGGPIIAQTLVSLFPWRAIG